MLQYTLRIRDLVHGTILFTELEKKVIDHIFFQRLRHIRQNDVAFIVYPSLNTSRFEHALGTCRVAGMIADHLTQSPKWEAYSTSFRRQTGLNTEGEFVQLTRLYALLHDIGHFPLSHLFEIALGKWAKTSGKKDNPIGPAEDWTGVTGFGKLHEAIGAVIIKQMIADVLIPEPLGKALTRLMTEKVINPLDPLFVIKAVVDSEIDADRIDSTQRDGLLAGGEYGNYDTRLLCDSVFIEEDEKGWLIAYSEKALSSMEALLLDRYRTHVWVHYHHRVVTMKILVRHLIERALEQGLITKEQFNPANKEEFALRDEVWLWNILRHMDTTKDPVLEMVKKAVFFREKKNVLNLWKGRLTYHDLQDQVKGKARVDVVDIGLFDLYLHELRQQLQVTVLGFDVPFWPIGNRATYLYSEKEGKLIGESLVIVSRLVAHLESIWQAEPQKFVLLISENCLSSAPQLTEKWIDTTAQWVSK